MPSFMLLSQFAQSTYVFGLTALTKSQVPLKGISNSSTIKLFLEFFVNSLLIKNFLSHFLTFFYFLLFSFQMVKVSYGKDTSLQVKALILDTLLYNANGNTIPWSQKSTSYRETLGPPIMFSRKEESLK